MPTRKTTIHKFNCVQYQVSNTERKYDTTTTLYKTSTIAHTTSIVRRKNLFMKNSLIPIVIQITTKI